MIGTVFDYYGKEWNCLELLTIKSDQFVSVMSQSRQDQVGLELYSEVGHSGIIPNKTKLI